MIERAKPAKPVDELDTYVYIDVSNIRAACLKTLKFKLDFQKLIKYLKNKYSNLQEVRYYEGIADGDMKKEAEFKKLSRAGYTVCGLARKAYKNPAQYKNVKCRKCGNEWRVQVLRRSAKLKSNVDVYLANDFLETAHFTKKPVLLVLMSCDGDYAEMIKGAINANEMVTIQVLATPFVKKLSHNVMSARLTGLFNAIPRFDIANINNIRDYIEQK